MPNDAGIMTTSYRYFLKDLQQLRKDTINNIKESPDYSKKDIELTAEFKELYAKVISGYDAKNGGVIVFSEHTAKVTKKNGLTVYVPNVWFVLAVYVMDFYRELGTYQKYFLDVAAELKIKDTGRYAEDLYATRAGTVNEIKIQFQGTANKVFSRYTADSAVINDSVQKLWHFVSNNYEYWTDSSSKKIDRSDFRESSVMSLLNLVQADQGYVSKIVDTYASSDEFEKYIKHPELIIAKISQAVQDKISPMPLEKGGRNLVVYGTPGCGKSYYVDNTILAGFSADMVIRTTFYQDYSNTDFVGQILPKIHENGSVSYSFIPGPFTSALELALSHPGAKVALIIEELNRGNAASIFGDIFQLLDRITDEPERAGEGRYSIYHQGILDYLKTKGIEVTEIRIPANMHLYATMNTSDQNVFTLDTAFKRRWEFLKLYNEFKPGHPFANTQIPGLNGVTWKIFVETLNEYIVGCKDLFKSEDKLIGVYFVTEDTLQSESSFAFKIFEYLWDDVFRNNHEYLFNSKISTLDSLLTRYSVDHELVFNSDFVQKLKENIANSLEKDE